MYKKKKKREIIIYTNLFSLRTLFRFLNFKNLKSYTYLGFEVWITRGKIFLNIFVLP